MMSEAREQAALIRWARAHPKSSPVHHLFAIPNGGSRKSAIEGAHLKAQGVLAGVPDLCLPAARGKYHGLFIEMKHGRNKPTQRQLECMAMLEREGYATAICYSADSAIRTIEEYMRGAKHGKR